ncbi:MAG TPA: carboxymuconolactone decarboxylase family protein [Bryobacteraceae bacterium]|nr:carboxymuconolactone decarboxylase family protein [Bryobacteraceae bacterium]
MQPVTIEPRLVYKDKDPKALQALSKIHEYLHHSAIEPGLLDLVYVRASQINRCAFCIDMHTKDARARGESEQRLYMLNAWREAPLYTSRERAALAWTEAVTVLTDGFVPDEVYEETRAQFSEQEMIELTMAIVAINSWNRINVAFRTEAGRYQVPATLAGKAGTAV